MIVPLQESNYTSAYRLFQTAFDMSENHTFKEAWTNRDRSLSLGYWVNAKLIGATLVCGHRLHYIYIDERYRSKGFGSELLQTILARSPTLHLTPVDNPKIHEWYVQHGFRLSQIRGAYRLYAHHDHDLRSIH